MSKYEPLWEYLKKYDLDELTLSFDEIKDILGFEIDHSFLKYKKESTKCGYIVNKISIKNRTVIFSRIGGK